MGIALATKFAPYTDEQFAAESKISLVTNHDFDWTGAHSIKIYKITTANMNDYDRDGTGTANWSRYGALTALDATTQEMTLARDRSFTFAIDMLDEDETMQQLCSAAALARQTREKIIPEIDTYTFGKICAGAGTKPAVITLTESNIYTEILKASEALDNAEAPEHGRAIVVTPAVYALMKKCADIAMETDIGNDLRLKGVLGYLDGCIVVKVPANRLPEQFGFLMVHPCATVAPVKLEEFTVHKNPPGISGDLVEGRICYDAFVLDNKKQAIYYQEVSQDTPAKE